jgi:hypothetical protein
MQATTGTLALYGFPAKREYGKIRHLQGLNSKRDTYYGDHKDQTTKQVKNKDDKPSQDYP